MSAEVKRVVRSAAVDVSESARVSDAIDQMYNDQLDVLLVRRGFGVDRMASVGACLDRDDSAPWARPHERMPVEDIQVLGTLSTAPRQVHRSPVADDDVGTPDPPMLPNGVQWDPQTVEKRFHGTSFLTAPATCFCSPRADVHRIGRVGGPRARVSMGGFLAPDKTDRRVLFWS